ncbi:hypothetical protein Ahy_A09g045041 isoform A [Arachis hypogaea]|uniref:Uncharacterized protein n=1 Tax=Arachis hypogaea TaxID=3818 RepID=A0A445BLD9_ARAHY|nr:hypothetical protein Ahy_A09g045041 isoform A [Arachis hypogaea]
MEVNSLGLFWISMAPRIQGMSTVVDRRGVLVETRVQSAKVDIRVQNAGLLRKYFVVLLRLSLHFPKVHQVMPLSIK